VKKRETIDFITLGCSKNLVDTERLMAMCEARGFHCTHDSEQPSGEVVVINTCGFIADAKEESINTILEFCQAKEEGRVQQVFVMGCLSERYLADLEAEIPEVDGWYGKFDYEGVIKAINTIDTKDVEVTNEAVERKLTTPAHYAYLKISEGCDRHCAYCAIPLITGRHRSRPMDEIISEVRWLVGQGVKEFQVIAQELTYYGIDLDGHQHIAELVERMADVEGVEWIRLHYAYPSHFPMDLLRVMRERKNVCSYLDIALQHISDPVLQRMQRNITKQETYELIETLRREVPGICLRTTLMVGFPGETDEDFQELMDFVRWARFERMGAFAYSEEDGTPSARLYTDDVPAEVKQQRLDRLMRLQQRISAEVEEAKVGSVMRTIIDRQEGDYFVGRTEFCSPEVDPEVLIPAKECLELGRFYNVKMTDSEAFDLFGTTQY
jgi:ribosomal protein S12 methylthiotransferase